MYRIPTGLEPTFIYFIFTYTYKQIIAMFLAFSFLIVSSFFPYTFLFPYKL